MQHMKTLIPEWETQFATLVTWPHPNGDWNPWLKLINTTYFSLVTHIARFQPVYVVCLDSKHVAYAQSQLNIVDDRIRFLPIAHNDTWIRDYGPITLRDEHNHYYWLNFTFNGYGNKYNAHADDAVTEHLGHISEFSAYQLQKIPFVLEGGSFDYDGDGTLITTAECLLHPTRNPNSNKESIETLLKEVLGVKRVLWLDHGFLMGDDTDSHVDMLARFINPNTIVYCQCQDPSDPHYAALQAMEKQLQSFVNIHQQPYHLIPLPQPHLRYSVLQQQPNKRLPASYLNFIFVNGGILVSTFNDVYDEQVLAIFRELCPDRTVVPIDTRFLIEQGGGLHCATMQIPAIK